MATTVNALLPISPTSTSTANQRRQDMHPTVKLYGAAWHMSPTSHSQSRATQRDRQTHREKGERARHRLIEGGRRQHQAPNERMKHFAGGRESRRFSYQRSVLTLMDVNRLYGRQFAGKARRQWEDVFSTKPPQHQQQQQQLIEVKG